MTAGQLASPELRDLIGAQRERLVALVRSRAGSRVDADEVVQQALERALERAHQLREPGRAEAWLSRVVRNVLIDELRRRRVPVLPVEELELPTIDESDAIDCWCVLVQAEQLKPEYADIIRRVIIDGVPVTQVAPELGLTANNAMVRLHRARTALRARLKEHCGTTTARSCSECGCEEGLLSATMTSSDRDGRTYWDRHAKNYDRVGWSSTAQ